MLIRSLAGERIKVIHFLLPSVLITAAVRSRPRCGDNEGSVKPPGGGRGSCLRRGDISRVVQLTWKASRTALLLSQDYGYANSTPCIDFPFCFFLKYL